MVVCLCSDDTGIACLMLCSLFIKVELLSHDTCLALNLLLAKHKFVSEELATWLMQGNVDAIGIDTFKLLITLLPSHDEVRSGMWCSLTVIFSINKSN